jgi:hypothetical protein
MPALADLASAVGRNSLKRVYARIAPLDARTAGYGENA